MKNRLLVLGMLVMVLAFGMTVIVCDDGNNGGNSTDPALNGTWIGDYSMLELKFNNGNFEFSEYQKGTYTTSGGNITMTPTYIYEKSKWNTKDEMRTILQEEGLMHNKDIEEMLNQMFSSQTGPYVIKGGTLIIIFDDTITFTKSDGGNSASNDKRSELDGSWGKNGNFNNEVFEYIYKTYTPEFYLRYGSYICISGELSSYNGITAVIKPWNGDPDITFTATIIGNTLTVSGLASIVVEGDDWISGYTADFNGTYTKY